ncbi:putative xylosidase/glycosyl hydrolase [Coniochaeta sp. 2T2.1]|nr:putative xylosidase/glycosyl hydrolase [Coniochaeta sp. 2T2.1]
MQYSPGAPVLRSKDLVNWDVIGHSLPTLPWAAKYNLTGGNAYNKGTWASTLRYRKSNKTWYWIGCIEQSTSYVYTAPDPTGPWTAASTINTCYYDCGLLIDDDDKMHVVYGNGDHYIAELSADGLSQVKTTKGFGQPPGQSGVEGNRLYKKDGTYHVLNDHPGDTTYVWKSASIYGSYSYKAIATRIASPVTGGDVPHQGSLVETPAGEWYFMSFTWIYPGGRIPVLAPVTYAMPMPTVPTAAWLGTYNFTGPSLSPKWEWNHNPDPTKYSVNNGVTLRRATVTDDIFSARNTLTHREHGSNPTATIELDIRVMADGDKAGLVALRDWTAYIAVTKSGNTLTLQNVKGCTMAQGTGVWKTNSTGTVAGSATLAGDTTSVLLRGVMGATPATKSVSFSYSVDGGKTFKGLGSSFTLNTDWHWFQGQRWAVFNFATKALGGEVVLKSFTQTGQDK